MITRRKFLKWLAVGVPTLAAMGPMAIAGNGAAVQPDWPKPPIPGQRVWADWLTMDELGAHYSKNVDKNPIFKGELGIYNGVTIYTAK